MIPLPPPRPRAGPQSADARGLLCCARPPLMVGVLKVGVGERECLQLARCLADSTESAGLLKGADGNKRKKGKLLATFQVRDSPRGKQGRDD